MLYLITGLPGAGKTLNTIKTLCEDPRFQNRPVYYHNIKSLALSWEELTKEQANSWFDLPENSVVILDECQDIFPPRKVGAAVPESVSQLSTHRHRGFDIFLITQHPMLLDTAVRRLVGNHFHYVRQYGMNRVKCYEWQKCANDPEDYHAKQEAEKKVVKIDSAYFEKYRSAEVHTHKPRVSKKLVVTLACFFAVVVGIILFVTSFSKDQDFVPTSEEQEALPDGILVQSHQSNSYPVDAGEYAELFKPRIEGYDYTAPFYDELTRPKTFPKPSCIINETKRQCRCYTQQATRLDVDDSQCRNIVKYGWFDFTKEDVVTKSRDDSAMRLYAIENQFQGEQVRVVHHSDDRRLDRNSRVDQILQRRQRQREGR